MKSSPIKKACAILLVSLEAHSNVSQTFYQPSKRLYDCKSSGVDMISISRMPANIKTDNG